VKECYRNDGETCLNGKNVCVELNETFKNVIGKTLDAGDNNQIKAYRITIKYYARGSQNKTWFTMQEGSFNNCTERYGGDNIISESPGSLSIRLEVCKGKNGEG
jgi:hypothetical protein